MEMPLRPTLSGHRLDSNTAVGGIGKLARRGPSVLVKVKVDGIQRQQLVRCTGR